MTRDWWKPWRSNLKVFRLNQHTLGPLNTFWTLECAPVCLCHLFCSANPAIKPTTLKAALSDILMAPTYRTSNDTKISIIFFLPLLHKSGKRGVSWSWIYALKVEPYTYSTASLCSLLHPDHCVTPESRLYSGLYPPASSSSSSSFSLIRCHITQSALQSWFSHLKFPSAGISSIMFQII